MTTTESLQSLIAEIEAKSKAGHRIMHQLIGEEALQLERSLTALELAQIGMERALEMAREREGWRRA